ncbi:MAG: DUF308 domain-containing protein [Muribaculum sp.]|nr:DUF308 domain-containing protein [Muribaculum sp.]
MKNISNIFIYLAALVVGILLLIFHQEGTLLRAIIIAIGVLILIPAIVVFIRSFLQPKDANGVRPKPLWYVLIVALAGIVFGAWMVFTPDSFRNWTVYVLGAILILSGISGFGFTVQARRGHHLGTGWFVTPTLVAIGGIILIILGPSVIGSIANIAAGVLLVVYAVNGFSAIGREREKIDELENEATDTESKLETDSAESASDKKEKGKEDKKEEKHHKANTDKSAE